MKLRLAAALALVPLLSACSITLRADRIEGRASLFAGANRETKESVETAAAESAIVSGLLAEAGGRDELARAYLGAKGYSAAEIDKRIALARVRPAVVVSSTSSAR